MKYTWKFELFKSLDHSIGLIGGISIDADSGVSFLQLKAEKKTTILVYPKQVLDPSYSVRA